MKVIIRNTRVKLYCIIEAKIYIYLQIPMASYLVSFGILKIWYTLTHIERYKTLLVTSTLRLQIQTKVYLKE